jgi:NitT/TauT family transport system substrate-binding protein
MGRSFSKAGRSLTALLALACLCATLTFASCGGGSNGGGGESGKPATVTVGVIPIADVAPLYVGIKQGFFKQEKLTIKPKLAEGGAAITAAVVSGDDQIGFSNVTSLLIASSKNLPVQILAQGVVGGPKPTAKDAWDGLLVKSDSPIKKPKDLEGKTVAVNNLNNVGPLTINRTLEKAGVDYKKVKYTEVPFPEMNAAIDAGRIDAGWMVEPFVSQGLAAGERPILYPFEAAIPNLTVATYFSSKQYIQKNGDVVDRFVRAINKSLEYAQSHPDGVRKVVPTYTKIPPKVAQKMHLPQWKSDLGMPTIEETSKLAQKYGFMKKQPDLGELVRQGG